MAAYIALRGWEGAATDSTAHVPFECTVLDADEAPFRVQQRWGVVVYVRVISGTLPATLPNILIAPYGWLIARPATGAFAPVAASLSVPPGPTHPSTTLARLRPRPGLGPSLRAR